MIQITTSAKASTPTATPTPTPAFAPVERPLSLELLEEPTEVGADGFFDSAPELAVEEAGVVDDVDVEEGEETVDVADGSKFTCSLLYKYTPSPFEQQAMFASP